MYFIKLVEVTFFGYIQDQIKATLYSSKMVS